MKVSVGRIKKLAWPLRKDDTHNSRRIDFFIPFCHSYAPQPYGSRVGVHRVGGRHTTGGGLLLFMVRLAWPLRKDDTFRTLRLFFVEQVE